MGERATARNGPLIVDEETQEGTVLDPVIDDESNDLEEAQHRILDSAISEHQPMRFSDVFVLVFGNAADPMEVAVRALGC